MSLTLPTINTKERNIARRISSTESALPDLHAVADQFFGLLGATEKVRIVEQPEFLVRAEN